MEQSDLSLLQTVPAYHLQAIARARHLAQSSIGKTTENSDEAGLIDVTMLAEILFDLQACRSVLRDLNDVEVSILRELVACGGRANSRDLALYLGSPGSPLASAQTPEPAASTTLPASASRPVSAGQSLYPTPHPHGMFEQALHHLLLLGLIFWGKQTNFVGRDYANGVYDGVLIVSPTVQKVADEIWQIRTSLQSSSLPPDEMPGEGMYAFQRALYLYWSIVAQARDGLPLVNSHLLARTALRQLVEHFAPYSRFVLGLSPDQFRTEADIPYLLFLRLMLLKLGLLEERNGAMHAQPAPAFFSLPLGVRIWRCFLFWQEQGFWNEMAFLPDVNIQPGPALLDPAHEEVIAARSQILPWLLACSGKDWQFFPTFIARMKLIVPYLLFPRQYGPRSERYSVGSNPYGWNFRLRRGWLTHREGWHMVEGGFIRAMITGPLHWLGLIELSENQPADSFRLAQGAGLIANASISNFPDPAWGKLIVQPNFDLIALAPVAERLLVDLDRFAERVRLEHIAQYHLSKASITRAIQAGMTAETIYQIIEQAAGGIIPQNVHYSLQEWERQARRIELWREATLLEVDDPVLLDELFADSDHNDWLIRRLSPVLAEVATSALPQLQELLWQRDYMPALTSASHYQDLLTGTDLPISAPQWLLSTQGLCEPCYPLTNLYLESELQHLTEIEPVSGWHQITFDSLQKALTRGYTLPGILRFLQTYCVDGIPGSLLVRLKLWGEGYQDHATIKIEHSPLLSLSPQVLEDICVDEEIGPLLGQAIPQEKRLVSISEENLEAVLRLLQERGFQIS